MTCLLGIDPGSRLTGFGLIEVTGRHNQYITSGCIRLETAPIPDRLLDIFRSLTSLIEQYQPTVLAIERVFMHRNPDSALKLGQARGAAIVAAMHQQLTVYEYSPNEIKQAIVGRGHADKAQVQYMVKLLLKLPAVPQADAADALAVALCHAHTQHHHAYVQAQQPGNPP